MAGSTIWAPVGEQGPEGPAGPPGIQGPPGPTGGPGPDAATFLAFQNSLLNFTDPVQGTAQVGRSDQIVASIAELRTLNKNSASKYATVTGFYAKGDGGAAFYYLDEADTVSVDNPGIVVVAADGARWKHNHNGMVSVKQFGARGTWNGSTGANDTTAFQAAMDCGVRDIYIPPVSAGFSYQLTAMVTISKAVTLYGGGYEPYTSLNQTGGANPRGNGSWLHFNHAGIGLNVVAALGFSGVTLKDFGTFRTHVIPGGATPFTPTVYDFDILVNNIVDMNIFGIMLLNPYNGIKVVGQQSRMTIRDLKGQPLNIGLSILEAYDICRQNDIHWWPFWTQTQKVWDYTLANLTSFVVGRCDNHMYVNCFSIFHHIGMQIVQGPGAIGTANKLKLVNCDLDRGYHGLIVDAGATGATIQATNLTIQGETGLTGSNVGLGIYAKQVEMDVANLDVRNHNSYNILLQDDYTHLGISGLYCSLWDLAGSGVSPIQTNSSLAEINISGYKRFYSGTSTAVRYGGIGVVRTQLSSGRSTASTNGSGDVTVSITNEAIPNLINISLNSSAALHWNIQSRTASSFTVRFYNPTGVPLTATAVDFNYECKL